MLIICSFLIDLCIPASGGAGVKVFSQNKGEHFNFGKCYITFEKSYMIHTSLKHEHNRTERKLV